MRVVRIFPQDCHSPSHTYNHSNIGNSKSPILEPIKNKSKIKIKLCTRANQFKRMKMDGSSKIINKDNEIK